MSDTQVATVEYQVATYSGSIDVFCDSDDFDEYIIAKAKRLVSNGIPLPFGYERWTITNREDAQ